MNPIFDKQRCRNAESRECWERFASHRARVTSLLLNSSGEAPGRLCILGAGNCNDLDLPHLSTQFDEIHLVDVDSEAVSLGIARQHFDTDPRLVQHKEVDLSGIADLIARWHVDQSPAEADIERCMKQAATASYPDLPSACDVVASTGLLTQLFDSASTRLGERHPRLLELLVRIRTRHIQLLFECLRPGGFAILISDFVSSETIPDLADIPEDELPEKIAAAIRARNFFTGAHPGVLQSMFTSESTIAPLACDVEMHGPWRWDLGPRVYAVCAIRARKRQ